MVFLWATKHGTKPILIIGVSVPNFLQTTRFGNDVSATQVSVNKERMNLYLIAGHVFDLSSDFKLKPAALVNPDTGLIVK